MMSTGFRNNPVDRRLRRRQAEDYHQRLKNIKPFLEISPPREHQHLQLSVKKIQMQQERQAAIDRQNQVILTQLMKIKQSPARVDNWNKQWKPSNDRLKSFRERKQRRIKLENEKQHERLKNVQPYYDVDKWEKDYKKHQYYLWLLDGGTKEYDEIGDEDEEDESDEEDKEKLPPVDSPDGEKGGEKNVKKKKEEPVKLPPIDGKKKGKDGGKKKDEYPEHVVIMDAEDIHKAIEDNDKEKILQILGRVSEKKKLDKLKQKYKELYDKDLMEDVKPKLDEEMQEMLDSLGSGAEEDATKLYEAMKGLGTDEDILIEILCTRSNAELKDIRAAYSKKYENSLESDLKGDTSGDLETLLVELSKGQRDESTEVDKELAKSDAKEIMEAGVDSWGTDEGKFIRIFTQRSRPQLGATFPEYKKLSNKDIADSIDSEMDGDLQKAFLTLVKCVRDPTGFHADKLHKALQEGDTKTVARIILGKNKAQLDELAAAYKKAHKVELADQIDKKCSGDLKQLMLAKLGKGKEKKKQQKPAEKQDKTKKEAAKDKPKAKAAAPQDNKKTDKNAARNKEEEAALEKNADELHKAIEAEDKTKIVDILAKNCADKSKLQKLQDKYKKKHDQDLLEAVKPILDEDLQEAVESLLLDSAVFDAKNLYNATKGLGTDEDVLIEVLCTRTNKQLKEINKAYSQMYGNSLESDLKGDTSGDLETMLVQLNKGQRDESTKVDKEMAKKDAKELQEAGVDSWGTDEGKFIRIFTQRSRPQLGATFPEYKKLTNKDIADSIDAEMDGDLQKAFLTIVKCVRDPTSFRLNKVQTALKEGDTKAVAAIILTKDKAQLDELAAAYKKANKVELADDVDKKCKGDTKTLLMAKLGRGKDKKQQQKPGAKQDAAKAKPKAAAGQDNKKTDKNAEKNKEENKEAALEKDVDELRKAIDAGDKDKVVDILAKHCDDKSKLQQLKDKYKEKHDQDLLEAVKPVLEEEQLQDAVESLFMESSSYDAKILYNAMKGLGTDEDVLIEVLCSRDNAELAKIKETYTKLYGRSLEKDIKGDTSGDFEDLLVELSKGKRDESTKVDRGLAKKDAEALMQAGYLGTDEDKFVEVFTQRSFAHLKAVFQEYKKICNQEMDEVIEEEMSQDLEKGFLALVKYTRDPATFYAAKLQKSLQDGDTDTAGRVIFTSSTAELADIVGGYKKLSGNDLIKDAEAKFSENMKKLILPRLKKAGQEQKEKEKASNDPKKKAAGGGKQDGAAGKKADAKPAANKKPAQQKKSQQDDKQEYSALREAIDANNKKKIKEIVCRNLENKDNAKKLVEDYNSRYGKELFESLEDKLDEDLIEALAALSLPKAMYDARTLHLAMKGLFTKELILIETFSTRTNAEIAAIRQAYKKKYRKELEQVIKDDTSGDFETLLVELCKGQRDESAEVNDDLAHKDAESLLEAGIKKWGTDEETFIEIFTKRSFPQLKAMLPEYKKWAKCEMEETIDSEMSGDLREGLQTLVKCIRDQNQFLADKLQVVLHGKSTASVARIILGESAIADIEKSYNATYKPKLAAEINTKCSNELKKVLLPKLKDTGPDKEPEKEEKPSSEKPDENKPEVAASDQSAGAGEKPRENADGSGNQEEKKKEEERPQLTIEQKPEYHGTLKPADNFNAAEDAETLKKAMKGFGSDEDAIMAVLGARTNKQRQEIAAKFQEEYNKNLVDELKSELGGKFEDAIVALMSTPELFDANSLHDAMSGLGTDEAVLIEILSSRSSEEIQTIKATFKQTHGNELVEQIKSETSGDLQTTLIKLAEGKRSTSENVDANLAYEDATKLFEAGDDKWGTDESVFIKILTTRSITQLQATFEAYNHVAKTDIMDSVNDELTGNFHDAIEAIVRCTRNPPLFFAEALEKALSGLTTDSKAVTRIVVTRSEIDLMEIKTEYEKKTGKTLKAAIEDELKGDLEKLLLQMIGD